MIQVGEVPTTYEADLIEETQTGYHELSMLHCPTTVKSEVLGNSVKKAALNANLCLMTKVLLWHNSFPLYPTRPGSQACPSTCGSPALSGEVFQHTHTRSYSSGNCNPRVKRSVPVFLYLTYPSLNLR